MNKLNQINQYQELADEKKKLRKELLAIRNAISEEVRKEKSSEILQTIYGMELYQETDTILAYVNYQSEVMTLPLIEKALMEGKQVFCPKVLGNEMEFYRINSVDELEEGYKGIYEPVSEEGFLDSVSVDNPKNAYEMPRPLMLMPGVAFDRNCHRLGYGKGFYDRYLTHLSENAIEICTIGLAYENQITNEVPCETHDISLDMIITEKEIVCSWQ